MKIITYCIVCLILFGCCFHSEGDTKLAKTLKHIVGAVCLLCLTLLSIF